MPPCWPPSGRSSPGRARFRLVGCRLRPTGATESGRPGVAARHRHRLQRDRHRQHLPDVDRRPQAELALLHKTGAIRRQVVWFIAAESLVLTLIGIVLSAVVSCLALGGLYMALAGETGSVSIILPLPLVGAILAGCMFIAVLTSTLPAWYSSGPGATRPAASKGDHGPLPGSLGCCAPCRAPKLCQVL